jgi:hypothetical protein
MISLFTHVLGNKTVELCETRGGYAVTYYLANGRRAMMPYRTKKAAHEFFEDRVALCDPNEDGVLLVRTKDGMVAYNGRLEPGEEGP